MLDRLRGTQTVVLPRDRRAARASSAAFIVPERAIDAQSLIAFADLVVSAGGTMNREAVALGTPVWTTFEGRLGAVDERLIAEGRLRRLERADALELRQARRRRRRDRVRRDPGAARGAAHRAAALTLAGLKAPRREADGGDMSAQASRLPPPACTGPPRPSTATTRTRAPSSSRSCPRTLASVVDVGCGQGALGGAIRRERGAWVLGLELVPEALEVARGRLDRVERVDLDAVEELPVAIGSRRRLRLRRRARAPARPRAPAARPAALPGAPAAWSIASIPNVKHWSVLAPLLLEDRFTYTQAGLLDRTHVHLFTLEEISAMLDRVGLEATHLDAVRFALPAELRPIGELVAHWGGDVAETIARLEAYQYLVVARSTEGGA